MNQDIRRHGVGYQMLASLPIFGAPSRFLMDYTHLGIEQYGYVRGIVRGGFVGLVMFSILLFLSEAIPLGWAIIKNYFDLKYVQLVMAEQREEILNQDTNETEDVFGKLSFEWLDPGRYLLRSKRIEPPPQKPTSTPTPTSLPSTPKPAEKASGNCGEKPVKGCLWLQLSKAGKLTFLLGTHDAVSSDSVLWNELFRKEWTFEDIIQNLDKFYSDSAKRDVPIIDAMKEVRSR